MRKRESEERFRGAESGNGRTTSKRAKLVDAIFSNRRKRSVCVALLGSAFVVGAWAPFEASRGRADETAVATTVNAASVSATTADAFEYRVEGNAATIEGIRDEFRDATTISVPNQIGETLVRKIAPGAFEGLDRLEELHCRAHLTEMGERAFAGCVALKQVRFSAPINTIAREAFAGCGALRFVEHDGIMVLGTGAFRGCAALEKFDVYQIAALEGDAFDGCRSLATFENSATQYRELQALQCVDGLALSRDGRTLIACPGARKGEVVVPDGVVSIASGAFAGGSVETVVLPQTLEVIERNAFANCRALKTVVGAPKTLATIRARAFFFCDALERFEWPENLQTVEEEAFANCRKLESATLKNVRTLGARAFCACSKLAALELSSETREIGAFAFAGTALKSFRLPRELETLGAWALDGIALSAVEIEEGNKALKIVDGAVLSVDGKMLYYRPSLASGTNWKIPEGVRVVVRGALDDNASLVSLEIPEGVEAIGEGAFSGCASLKKLAIPASVRRIDDRFLGCGALEAFEVAEDNPAYRSVDGALLSKDGKTIYRVAREGGSGMTKTPAYWNGREAKRVIPEGVERIAAGAIGDDRLMTSLEIPSTVKRIDADAFGICDRLSSLVIPASVERLDERFENCDALKDFRVESGNRYYTSVFGALLSKDWRTYYALVGKGDWTRPNTLAPSYVYEATVPKGVQTIEQNAFGGAWQMEKVVLPSTLRTIKRSAFSGATSLKSVTIPAGVDKIEKGAFVGAPLREVVLESSDARFDKSAFTTDLVGPTIRVADETLKRDKAEAEAKKAAEEAKRDAEKVAQETFQWEVVAGGRATITGVRDKEATSLDIPEKLNGAPVTAIAFRACAGLSRLKTVRIGANVERIDGAFQNCVNLESVEFPPASDGSGESKLHTIVNGGFKGCSSLKKFEAPRSLVSLGTFAFADCSALETVKLSPRTDEIGQSAFSNCSSLREIDVPESDGFLVIGGDAFKGCDALKSFDAPRKLTGLGWNAFGELDRPFQFKLHPESKRLQDVGGMILSRDGKNVCAYFGPKTGELVIPEGVERIGQVFGSILKGADFETIRLPKSLRVVQRQAFMESKSLKRVVLPADSALEEIGDSAFSGCEALESFDWPKSLKKVGIGAFSDCALKEFGGVPALETIGNYAFSNCGALSSIELPSGLREIGDGAFADCAATSIKIPASVQSVGETAFGMGPLEKIEVEEGNEALKVVDGALLSKDGKTLYRLPSALKLTSYKIPDGVEIVERAALGGNVTLKTVEIPSTVKTIEPNAFYRCVALKEISIPASVETMNGAFVRCDGLERFEVDPSNPRFKSENGALLSADGKTLYAILAVERDVEAEQRAALQAEADGDDSTAAKPIYRNPVFRVPDGVEKIDSSAFLDEAGMRNAFTEIVLPESVTEIGRLAFARCKRLEKAYIPKNVAKIYEAPFMGCDALQTVEISPENPNFRIENDMLLSKSGKTFYEVIIDRGETVLKIPEGVEGIAKTWIWSAFENGPTYKEVVLPESLTSLGEIAFNNWKNLTSITIPKNVKKIEARAFYNCPQLTEVVLRSGDTAVDGEAFYNYPARPKATIRVEESKELVRSVPNIETAVVEKLRASQTSQTSELKATQASVDGVADSPDEFEWREVQRGEVVIFAVHDEKATSVVIPETLGGAPVKTIMYNAFAGMKELKTVRLPRRLETIGSTAFDGCVSLEKIEFAKDENGAVASNLQKIDIQAFRGCVSLKSFEAPDSLVALSPWAFANCSSLETATFGKNLRELGEAAFSGCVALSRVDCSRCEQLETIGRRAFWNCGALSTFDAPASLRAIDPTAFAGRTAPIAFAVDPKSEFLKLVGDCLVTNDDNRLIAYFGALSGVLVVPEDVEEIGAFAFYDAAFETVRFPKGLRRVADSAFAGCSMKSVEITEDSALETIGNRAFFNCDALEAFPWPKSLKSIGAYAFGDCKSLKSLNGATSLAKIDDFAFSNCKALTTVELPNGLLEIGTGAFLNAGFASIKIPASVQNLRGAGLACTPLEKIEVEEGSETLKVVDGALLSKDGKTLHRLPPALKLKSYKIPDGVEIVERSALGGNVTLEKVELPTSVTTLEKDAFYRCEKLTEIAIPAKTESIDVDAFDYCDALERFEIDAANAVYKSENGALLSKDGKTFYMVVAVERDRSAEPFVVEPTGEGEEPRSIAAYKDPVYRVPDGVATICNNAFYDSRRARNAFTEIVLPESLIVIGANAFHSCERLETIRIPAKVTRLDAWAPTGQIDGLPISGDPHPDSLFGKCDALKTFEVAPENESFRSEDGALLSADGSKFYGFVADKGRSVWKVPEGVVIITSSATKPTKATQVVLPETLETIRSLSFRDCENLTSIAIPKNARQIEREAFYNCPRLAEVVLKSSKTKYTADSFSNCAPNLTIRVEEDEKPQAPRLTEPTQNKALERTGTATLVSDYVATLSLAKEPDGAAEVSSYFNWQKENDGAKLLGVNDKTATELVIPETLGGLPVKEVGDLAFVGMRELKTVRISKNLETIASRSFAGCVNLETIEFAKDENGGVASNLRTIGDSAFWKCAKFKAFAAPDSLVELGDRAFGDCPALETATLGKNLQVVSAGAFANCVALSQVDATACEKLTEIANGAFSNCGALSTFNAPASLRFVDGTAFAGRTTPLAFAVDPKSEFLKLVDGCLVTKADNRLVAYFGDRSGALVVPDGVVEIGKSVFADAAFETVRLPKSLRGVDNEAFKGCVALKSVVVPEDSALESIGADAFSACQALETFDWPKSLKQIGVAAFSGCESLKSLSGATSLERVAASAFWNCRALTTVELPSGLREIGALAFADAGYETVKIPASVQALGSGAFAGVSPLEKIEVEQGSETLKIVDGALLSKDGRRFFRLPKSALTSTSHKVPDGVEIVERSAFGGNVTLETVELPSTLLAIQENAFYRCVALKQISIPAKTFKIDDEAFSACDALERFEVDPKNGVYKSENGALLSVDGKTFYKLIAVERDPSAQPFVAEPTSEGGDSLFVPAYKSLVYRVPDGVTTISENAFGDPRKARNAFKEIVLPKGLKTIEAQAFSGCSKLETMRIPASVAQIGGVGRIAAVAHTFGDCDALKTFEVEPGSATFSSKDGMLLNDDGKALYGVVADRGRSVWKFPKSVESITWLSQGALEATEIVLPERLGVVPSRAFRNYPNLTSLTIPASVRFVEATAVSDCPRLAEVVLKSSKTKYTADSFSNCAPNLTIRVEEGAATNVRDDLFELEQLSDKTLAIKGVKDKKATTLEIPETLDGLRVSQIAPNAFAGATELRTVRFPASVETIGVGAFENCVNLEKVEFAKDANGAIASNLQNIDFRAFRGCVALKSFEGPDSLVRVAIRAFEGCSSLETVALGRNVASIETRAFADCVSLRRVDLSKAKKFNFLTTDAFDNVSPEIEYVVPANSPRLTSDGFWLSEDGKRVEAYFGGRRTEVSIPEGVEYIGKYIFTKKKGDFEVARLPKSLRYIEDSAFSQCDSLKRVVVPEDSALETIGPYAFADCGSLESFDWPKSLKTIGSAAFIRCRSFKSFKGATSVEHIGGWAFCDCESLTEVELPKGLISIGASAFAECGFTSIKIPASVRVFGDAALAVTPLETIEVEEGNEALKVVDGALLSKDGKSFFRLPPALKRKSFKIPEGVKIIERAALGGNETLESVEIPSSVVTIETNAFYRNSSLKEIVIPASVANLYDAFPLCDALERFEVDPNNAVYKSENGALLSKSGKTFYRIVAVKRDPSAAPIALKGEESLSEETKRDEGPRSIPAYKNDVYVVPDGVETLAEKAFSDLRRTRNAFTEIVLPQSLKKIDLRAFQYCPRLETLRIPANVASIAEDAFFACNALKTFEIDPKNRVFSAQDGMLLSANGKTFYGVVANQERRVLKAPEGVAVAASNPYLPKKFAELVLPESLVEINRGAFAKCENLTTVTIPKNVRAIGSLAFNDSPKLTEIVLKSRETQFEGNSFQGVAPNCKIRVEEETEKAAPYRVDVKPEDATTSEEARKVFTFAFEEGGATIVGLSTRTVRSVKIPAKIDDQLVVKIGELAFSNKTFLESVELPPTLREIGARAFAGCPRLKTISPLPASLEVLGDDAFSASPALTAIEVDPKNEAFQSVDGVLLSKDGKTLCAYPGGKNDKEYQVPDGVETIERGAFSRNAFIETVKFPWTLKTIRAQAFMKCEKLAEIRFFPVVNLLETIEREAFYQCDSLSSVRLPDGILTIESKAFGSNALETVDFYPVDVEAEAVMTIEKNAFIAPRLKSFEIPETIRSFAYEAVKSGAGASLDSNARPYESARLVVTLPANPVGVEPGAFASMENLVEIKVDPACNSFKTVDGVLLSADDKTLYFYPKTARAAEYDVPDGVERIVAGAFKNALVRKIRTPKTLKQIDVNAFDGVSLEQLEFGEGVVSVNPDALGASSRLTTLKLPATLQNADRVLEMCVVRFPNLANVEVAPGNPALKTGDGMILSADGKTLYFCSPKAATGEIVVPEGVETIASWAFARRSFESVRLPKTLKEIGENAFAMCVNLKSAPLPDGLEVVGARAFRGCDVLSSISLPASVKEVKFSPFAYCAALKSIDVAAENPTYRSVDGVLLSKDWKSICAYPCGKEATEYVAPASVETISAFAFEGAKKLRKVVLHEGVKLQGNGVFSDCGADLEIVER